MLLALAVFVDEDKERSLGRENYETENLSMMYSSAFFGLLSEIPTGYSLIDVLADLCRQETLILLRSAASFIFV